jgi:hypothetical protein
MDTRREVMPLFMDTHRLDGSVTIDDAATPDGADLREQGTAAHGLRADDVFQVKEGW